MVPHSWLKETLKTVGVADNIRRLLGQSMRNWKIVLTLNEVSIQRGIFQRDSLSPLLFNIILIHLSMTLNSTNYSYPLSKETPINHLLFMDDLKLYGKTKRELLSLIHTVRIILQDISTEFGMGKYSTVRIRKVKICDMEDIEMPDGQ